MTISIKGLDKAEVLMALYNASHQQGMGFMHARGATGMSLDEARKEIQAAVTHRLYFDYLHGRVMKVGLNTDDLEERLYDRDNGYGAAARALDPLLSRVSEERPTRRADDDDSTFIASMAIPSVMAEPDSAPVAEPFTGGGGDFAGAGASGSWDGGGSSSDSGSSSSSDSGSSDSGSSSSDSSSSSSSGD